MNRRQLISGILAASAISLVPSAIEAIVAATPETNFETWFAKWQDDMAKVLADTYSDILIFGRGAWRNCDHYPFIESIDPMTLPFVESETQFKGLLP